MLTHLHSRWFICFPKLRFSDQRKTPQWQTGLCPNNKKSLANCEGFIKSPIVQVLYCQVDMCNMPVKLHIPHFPVNIEYFYLPDIFLSHHSLITPPLISHIPIKRQRINPIFILVFIFDDRRKLYSCIYFKFKCKIINVILNQSNFFIRHFQ